MSCGLKLWFRIANQLAEPYEKDILEKLAVDQVIDKGYQPFGDGHASEKIVKYLLE